MRITVSRSSFQYYALKVPARKLQLQLLKKVKVHALALKVITTTNNNSIETKPAGWIGKPWSVAVFATIRILVLILIEIIFLVGRSTL